MSRQRSTTKDEMSFIEKASLEAVPNVDYSGAHAKSSATEIRLVRKLDFIILPTLWIMYWFNYLDRNAITVARLDDMEEELGLTDTQYLTCVSILFVGYILGQIPSSKLTDPSLQWQRADRPLFQT